METMRMARGVFVFVGVLFASAAHAATYYASTSGSDSYTCAQAKSTSTPKGTLAAAGACLAAGDTLLVRGGTYNEGITNSIPSGTSWTNKVRVAAYPAETVWLATKGAFNYVMELSWGQSYIELDGLNLNAANQTYGILHIESVVAGSINTHHIRVQNAELVGNPAKDQQGVLVVNPLSGSLGGD